MYHDYMYHGAVQVSQVSSRIHGILTGCAHAQVAADRASRVWCMSR